MSTTDSINMRTLEGRQIKLSQVQVSIALWPQNTDVWERPVLLVEVQAVPNHELVWALHAKIHRLDT